MNPVDLRLYGIIDTEWTSGRDPVDLVRQAVAGGATLIDGIAVISALFMVADPQIEARRLWHIVDQILPLRSVPA